AAVLPPEVAKVKQQLAGVVKSDNAKRLVVTGLPDFIAGNLRFSSVDVNASPNENQLDFALRVFPVPTAKLTKTSLSSTQIARLRNALNVYLANEVAVRESDSKKVTGTLQRIKGVKFYLQFVLARVDNALGTQTAGEVEHQRGKVLKNAGRASAA
ncbi:hypothetical protein BJ742DRAFT_665949, partial [Cladochytrium replicatum]